MAVSNFTSDPAGSTGQLSNLGAQNLKVGARITTVASQATGLYTGAFTVTVEYN
jgi:hypothetical protein